MKSVKPILLSLSLSALLVSCDDGGSGGNAPVGARHVATVEDAGPCNDKNDEETVLVGEERDPWWCDASTGTWTRLGGDDGDSSEEGSSDDLSSAGDESSSSGKSGGTSSKKSSSSSSSSSVSSSSAAVVVDCSGKTATSGDHNVSVTVDGKKRTFVMRVPSAYKGNKPVPLFVDYHALGASGSNQYGQTKYKSKTDPEGVITLYPDGTRMGGGGIGSMAGWNVGPCCSNDDDVKFTREMIKYAEEVACIDPTRVYAAGFSIGGGMAQRVGCEMADVFAAIAPAAMDLDTSIASQCNPSRPISVIMFRGTADSTCLYAGGPSSFDDGLVFLGAEENFDFWAAKNGCTGSPTTNADGCREYSNCEAGTKVVLCAKQDGGHAQGDGAIGWPFLKQFTLQ